MALDEEKGFRWIRAIVFGGLVGIVVTPFVMAGHSKLLWLIPVVAFVASGFRYSGGDGYDTTSPFDD